MKQITVTIPKILELKSIRKQLIENRMLSTQQRTDLISLLTQITKEEDILSESIDFEALIPVKVWDIEKLNRQIKNWKNLFQNLPDYYGTTFCLLGSENEPELLRIHTIIAAFFSPTLSRAIYLSEHANENESFELHLKDDETANFKLPSLEDAGKYPKLYTFKGSWKEAYLLLIETLKKGWPMEEFPEELQQFLKKE